MRPHPGMHLHLPGSRPARGRAAGRLLPNPPYERAGNFLQPCNSPRKVSKRKESSKEHPKKRVHYRVLAHGNSFVIGNAVINTHTLVNKRKPWIKNKITTIPGNTHIHMVHTQVQVGLAAAKAAALRVNLNVQGCGIVAPPMHASSRTPLLLPLLLSHNLPTPRVH
jgi:hypothetical protein